MIDINTINYSLTGTSYGFLSAYPDIIYKDSYLLTDFLNNANVEYGDTLSGNGFFDTTSSSIVSSISGLILWLDGTDNSALLKDRSNILTISGIKDKSQKKNNFLKYLDLPFESCTEWSVNSAGEFKNWTSIIFGDGVFVAAGNELTYFLVTSSIDDKNVSWRRSATVPQNDYVDIAYGETTSHGRVFVAVASGSDSYVVSNNKGLTWTSRTIPSGSDKWKAIAYGNNKFVAISESKSIYWTTNNGSSNTQFETALTNSLPPAIWQDLTFGNGSFVAISSGGNLAARSVDGINWTSVILPVSSSWKSLVYGYDRFIAVGGTGFFTVSLSSSDGANWSQIYIQDNSFEASPISINYSASRDQYVVVFDRGLSLDYAVSYVSNNGGFTWMPKVITGEYNIDLNSVAVGKNNYGVDLFLAVGNSKSKTNVAVLSCPFYISDPLGTATWPATCFDEYTINGVVDFTEKKTLNFVGNKALFNDSFYLNLLSGYSLFFVWRDNNYYDISIPLGIKAVYYKSTTNVVSSEFVLSRNYDFSGSEGFFGFKKEGALLVKSFYDVLTTNNIFTWYKSPLNNFDVLSSNSLFINTSSLSLSTFLGLNDYVLQGSKIGYIDDFTSNNFLFGELIVYDRVLNDYEQSLIKNYISNKYCFPYYSDNLTFDYELTGGPFSNYSYEDYSSIKSVIELPTQSCVTKINVSLSSFETTRSKIQKVVYSCGDISGSINSNIISFSGGYRLELEKDYFSVYVVPSNTNTIETYSLFLSVFRNDATLNKIVLSGKLLKCSVFEIHQSNKFLDSQILDDSKDIIMVNENIDRSLLFLNKLNIDVPFEALSGGDVQALINSDFEESTEQILLLTDLLEERPVEKLRRPYFVPVPAPRINPIKPE